MEPNKPRVHTSHDVTFPTSVVERIHHDDRTTFPELWYVWNKLFFSDSKNRIDTKTEESYIWLKRQLSNQACLEWPMISRVVVER